MTWRVARSLTVLFGQVNEMAPTRSKASDGTIGDAAHQAGTSDHNPDRYGIVRAGDVTHDPGDGADMHRLADDLVASRDPRIKYVIWDRRICSGAAGPSPWTWRPYSGSNPHAKHLHLSVVGDSRADQTHRWMIGDDEMMTAAQFVAILRDPTVAATMRALPWQYVGGGIPPGRSTLNVFAETHALVGKLGEAIARESANPAEIRALLAELPQPVDADEIATEVLAGLGTRPIADVAAALVAAGQDPAALAAELTRLAGTGT